MNTHYAFPSHDQSIRDLACVWAAAKAAVQVYVERTLRLESDFAGHSYVPEHVAEYRLRQIQNATAVVAAMAVLFEDPEHKDHMLATATAWVVSLFNEAK